MHKHSYLMKEIFFYSHTRGINIKKKVNQHAIRKFIREERSSTRRDMQRSGAF